MDATVTEMLMIPSESWWLYSERTNGSKTQFLMIPSLCNCLLRRCWQMHLASQTGEAEDSNRRRDEYNQSVSGVSSQLHIHKHSPSLLVLINL